MAIIFDGRKTAAELEEKLKREVLEFKMKTGIIPKVVDVIVGDDPASILYANLKKKVAERIGMAMDVLGFTSEVEINEVMSRIDDLNNDRSIHGILVQLPLPSQYSIVDTQTIVDRIKPEKDVDCITSGNLDLLKTGKSRYLPATVKAIIQIIHNSSFVIHNSNVCIVGASGMIGRSLSDYLKSLGAEVVDCDEFTADLSAETVRADLLISTTGVPGLIKKEMVKPGAVVIDVGSPKGDVDFENVKDVASFITPVPRGVGPMTIISLLENTLLVAESF